LALLGEQSYRHAQLRLGCRMLANASYVAGDLRRKGTAAPQVMSHPRTRTD